MESDELLYEMRGPDGHVWRVNLDGRIEGFPDGTVILNRAIPLVDALMAGRSASSLRSEKTNPSRGQP